MPLSADQKCWGLSLDSFICRPFSVARYQVLLGWRNLRRVRGQALTAPKGLNCDQVFRCSRMSTLRRFFNTAGRLRSVG